MSQWGVEVCVENTNTVRAGLEVPEGASCRGGRVCHVDKAVSRPDRTPAGPGTRPDNVRHSSTSRQARLENQDKFQ